MKKSTVTTRPASSSDQTLWNTHVEHPLQTWEWGEFRKAMGVDVTRLIIQDKKHINACWQITFHSIPHTPWTIGYFPKGPMPDQYMLDELIKWGKKKHAIYIQLEPNIQQISNFKFPASPAVSTDRQAGGQISNFVPSHHPLFTKYTFVLDLTKSEDDLLARMHPKTRYNIRLAKRHGVTVQEDSSDTAFNAYIALSEETTKRQRFYAHNRIYHRTMWHNLKKHNIARLFTATYNHTILAAWIIFCFKQTMYYPYGASSRKEHREVMAPNLMLWELMRWGKAHGFKQFDLWGAVSPLTTGAVDTHDPWYGFHKFKEGYGPELVSFIGSYDLIINPLGYKAYCLADTIRWNLLKIKSNLKFII